MTQAEPEAPPEEERLHGESEPWVVPIAFIRRLVELTTVQAPATTIVSPVHPDRQMTWQELLECQCEALGMRGRCVSWTVREAFGAAGASTPLVSRRSDPRGGEWLALVGRSERRVSLLAQDGSTRQLSLPELETRLGEDAGTVRSWVVVENRFPFSIQPSGPPGSHPGVGDGSSVSHDPSHAPSHDAGHGVAGVAGGRGQSAHASPFRRLLGLLRPERKDLWAIALFAAIIGALTLATPIAVQQLVNSIAFGGLIQPVVVLALLLLAVLAFSAVLAGLQAYVAELVQRRIFVRVVLDVAERLPRVHARVFDRHHGPELVNRVFDVVTVQKVGSLLLLEGTSVLLQTTVGLIVLSFYHPLMLAFSGLLITGILIVVVVMGRGAVGTAIAESKAKYDTVGWLEELALHASTFRTREQRGYALDRVDRLASAWIGARTEHYKIVLRQLGGALTLQVLANSALLALGGVLVVQGQLTLGQLVASELIITVIVAAVAKFGKQLEHFYDLLAAIDKLSILIDLPLERTDGNDLSARQGPATVEMTGVDFGYGPRMLFDGIDIRIEAGERLALEGAMGTGKSTLLDLLYGLRQPSDGFITIDGDDYRDLRLESLRSQIALVREPEIFSGSIRENIRVGRYQFSDDEIRQALDAVGLLEEVRELPQGIETRLAPTGRPLSQVQASRLALARAILARPRLLLVDRALEDLDRTARERICDMLFDSGQPWTLVVVSEREDVLARCTRRLTLGSPEVWRDRIAHLDPSAQSDTRPQR